MHTYPAKISEIGWDPGIGQYIWLDCPPDACPPPGRYTLAWSPEQPEAPLATPLFACRFVENGFQAALPVPGGWGPGTHLLLCGPLGQGFTPPAGMRKLALAGLNEGIARLLPLLDGALSAGAEVALFCDAPPPELPVAVEINALAELPEALAWADYLALDLPGGWDYTGSSAGQRLQRLLGFDQPPSALPCPAQALVTMPMPCSGVAECGACAVFTRQGYALACEDGPVFNLLRLMV